MSARHVLRLCNTFAALCVCAALPSVDLTAKLAVVWSTSAAQQAENGAVLLLCELFVY